MPVNLLDKTYAKLPDPVAQLYRRLGAAGLQDFELDLASKLFGEPAKAALSVLVGAHLLTEQGARYRFGRLIAEHARNAATAGDANAPDVALQWFLERMAFADLAITGGTRLLLGGQPATGSNPFTSSADAMEWVEAERQNLLPLLRGSSYHEVVWKVAELMTSFYYNRRYVLEWATVTQLGLHAARRCGHVDATARLMTTFSRPLLELGELSLAKAALDEAVLLANGDEVKASAHEFRGRYFDKIGQYSDAIAEYQLAQRLNGPNSRGYAVATLFLGTSLAAAGEPGAAETLRKALALLQDEPRLHARALATLGTVLRAKAVAALKEAIAAFEEGGWQSLEAGARVDLAKMLDGRESAAQLRLAQSLYAQFGSPKAAELEALLAEMGGVNG